LFATREKLKGSGVVLFVVLGCLTSTAQNAQPFVPDANPARPTVATPATLTPVGYLQFETGGELAQDSPGFSNWANLNEVVKLSVHPRFELILPFAPVAGTKDPNITGFGGLSFGGQMVLFGTGDANTTLSISYLHLGIGSPVPDTDIGTASNSGLILLSTNAGKFHFDTNAFFNEQISGSDNRTQFGQTLSISHPVWKLTGAGEIWHFTQPFLHGDAVGLLWAVSYPVRKNLVVDGGFNHGLTNTSTQWEEFFGFTYLLPRKLWHSR